MARHIDSTSENVTETVNETLDYDLTRNVDRRFICPICLGIMRKPAQTKCGHRFCSDCILAVIGIRERAKCPVDNILILNHSEIFTDLAFEREINSLSTACPNREEGCDWFAELKLLKEHIKNCQYDTVTCEDCKQTMTRKTVSEHKSSDCLHRIIKCEHCEQEMPEVDKLKHQVVMCLKFPVNCTQCGQTGFMRDNIAQHVDGKTGNCPATIVHCHYQRFGCNFMNQRQHMVHHLTRESEHHHLLIINEMTRLESRIATMQQDFTNQLITSRAIENKLQDVQRTIGMNDAVQKIFKENYSGSLLWQIDVTSTKNRILHSPWFYTANPGYRVSAHLDLAGYHDDFDSFVSLCVTLEDGKYDQFLSFPFSGICQVTVYDQSDTHTKPHHSTLLLCHTLPHSSHGVNASQDYHKFMKATEFLGDRYTRNGTAFIEVKVMQAAVSLSKT